MEPLRVFMFHRPTHIRDPLGIQNIAWLDGGFIKICHTCLYEVSFHMTRYSQIKEFLDCFS